MAIASVAASASGQQLAALPGRGEAGQLTPEQRQEVQRLKAIDQKVRQHEQAHQSAGAGITGAASYQYVRGPDGRQYAVAGEVQINASPGATPSATIDRARRVRAAALAPADPSAQDRAVAAAAAVMESQARAELARVRRDEVEGNVGAGATSSPGPGSMRAEAVPARPGAAALAAYQAAPDTVGQNPGVDVFA